MHSNVGEVSLYTSRFRKCGSKQVSGVVGFVEYHALETASLAENIEDYAYRGESTQVRVSLLECEIVGSPDGRETLNARVQH